jgi:hypothetical protein
MDEYPLVLLFDIDNTLLDNDLVKARLERELLALLGERLAAEFWNTYEEVRISTGVVDFPEILRRFRIAFPDARGGGRIHDILFDFPFGEAVYPDTFAVLAHANKIGLAVVLSDGDQVFQRHKVRRAGIDDAVDGRVLVFGHKEDHLTDIMARFPAPHYAMVDDKPRIQEAMKERFGDAITTIQVRQGKYAYETPAHGPSHPDITIDGIGELLQFSRAAIIEAPRH